MTESMSLTSAKPVSRWQTFNSPFHVKAAWILPLMEGCDSKLMFVDGNRAVSEDCTFLFERHANEIHRINLIYSPISPEDTKEMKTQNGRKEYENTSLFQTITHWMNCCPSLTVLKLKGFPLTKDMADILSEALRSCRTIQHLSLEDNSLGDENCFTLCAALTSAPTVSSISFQGNNLTKDSAAAIAALLGRQEIIRGLAWWKRSLRNRPVKTDSLLGLNRITLNNNPQIGDEGLHLIVDSLYDDFWIKAVDMQSCGITDKGAAEVVKLLKVNKGINVFDIRKNDDVSLYSLRSIMLRISQNLGPNVSEAMWLSSEPSLIESSNNQNFSSPRKIKKNPQSSINLRLKKRDFRSRSIELIRSFSTGHSPLKRVSTAYC